MRMQEPCGNRILEKMQMWEVDKMRLICEMCGTPANKIVKPTHGSRFIVYAICRNRFCENANKPYPIGELESQYIEC
jgi:hypothetical protein